VPLPELWQVGPERDQRILGLFYRAQAARRHLEVPLGAASAFRGRVSHRRRHEPVAFQTIERRVDGTHDDGAPADAFDLVADAHAIGVVTDAQHGEEDHQLEIREQPLHILTYYEKIQSQVKLIGAHTVEVRMLRGIGGDVRIAVRFLCATPAVAAAAILTLALGIGATTAIFSVVNGLAFRRLPVRNPQHLVTISSDSALRHGFQAGGGWSFAMWARFRDRSDEFDGAFAWALQRLDLSEGGEVQAVNGLIVSNAFFDVLGVGPAVGRTFTLGDDSVDPLRGRLP
jgi:MacB-like periplasmic core domain